MTNTTKKEELINMIRSVLPGIVRPFTLMRNDPDTWIPLRSLLTEFLESLRKQNDLKGNSAEEAFNIEIGLGSSMTPEDILNNTLRIRLYLAFDTPGVFTEIETEFLMSNLGE